MEPWSAVVRDRKRFRQCPLTECRDSSPGDRPTTRRECSSNAQPRHPDRLLTLVLANRVSGEHAMSESLLNGLSRFIGRVRSNRRLEYGILPGATADRMLLGNP